MGYLECGHRTRKCKLEAGSLDPTESSTDGVKDTHGKNRVEPSKAYVRCRELSYLNQKMVLGMEFSYLNQKMVLGMEDRGHINHYLKAKKHTKHP